MPGRTTIYRAAWVLPVATEPVRDGAVLVDEDGRIAAVGPRAAIDAQEGAELVRVGISPHAPYTVADALFTAAARYACDEALPMAIHAGESVPERDLVTRGEGDFAPGLRARGIDTPPRGRSSIEMLDR